MEKERFLSALADSLSTPLPDGYGIEVEDRSAAVPPPAERERRIRTLVSEGRITVEEGPSSSNREGDRWAVIGGSRRVHRLDDSLSERDVSDLVHDIRPGSGLWFTFNGVRKFRCNCGDYLDGLARTFDPKTTSLRWQEFASQDERVLAASIDALGALQTYLRRALNQPWPANGGALPEPGASVANDVLALWFGAASEPVLVFPVVNLNS